jgi:tetraacyldisaccharide 4'-kinase
MEAHAVNGRGLAGAFEDSWSGRPGSPGWTAALAPFAVVYGAGVSAARRRAASSRRRVSGMSVIAVGNLTVGGTGKSSLARFLAERATASGGRAAVLLRGHGGRHGNAPPAALPDFAPYPLSRLADQFGDEAAAHRAALSDRVAVVVGHDRHLASIHARDGYGATTAVLDDGWEQGSLAWDQLWVTLDPVRPIGNGRLLPAGPLRRPPETLAEADVAAFVQETGDEVPRSTLDWVRRLAPKARIARFRRVLLEVTRVGVRSEANGRGAEAATRSQLPAEAVRGAALITAVGSPERVVAFAEQAGIRVLHRTSFPDHARVEASRLRRSLEAAARSGAGVALITEKDEHRWILPDDAPLPIRVIRTGLIPLDPL